MILRNKFYPTGPRQNNKICPDSSSLRQQGFTLLELIVVIVVMGIIAVIVGPLLTQPIVLQNQISERNHYVNTGDNALVRIFAELKNAVPNSIRVSDTGSAAIIEFMPVHSGARYRYGLSGDDTALFPSGADDAFEVLGTLDALPTDARLVVNSTDTATLYSAAANDTGGVITPSTTTVILTNSDEVTLTVANQFDSVGSGSPRNRVYVTTTPVMFYCDKSANTIQRITDYDVSVSLPTNLAASPLNTAGYDSLLAENVLDCSIIYDPGDSLQAGMVTLVIEVGSATTGEKVDLMEQTKVWNAP